MERSLGDFGKLPAELRLSIWEVLLSSGSAAILRTNKAIFNDIAGRLYNTLQLHISPSYSDSWLLLQCKRLRVSWHLSKPELMKKSAKFRNLPWGSLKLVVHVYAPAPNDPGEIILLWQRVEDFVSLLNDAESRPSQITVRLQNHHNHSWEQEDTINESIKYPGDALPDFVIPFLSLCWLKGVQDFQVTSDSCTLRESPGWAVITRCSDIIMNQQKEKYQNPAFNSLIPMFDNIIAWRINAAFFLDTSLDSIPGPTADLLRRERFAEWFVSQSSYRKEHLDIIREHPYVVPIHDPSLRKWRHRCDIFQLKTRRLYLMASRSRYSRNDPRLWSVIYPNGLGAFAEPEAI
ncbi:hypothetical protein ASPCADRAFT_7547 [Aspergillus carbonarius ITEM 5010]|uniref:Uncharacterized protein n=1 Tax=Aspergillus carbonarius (strain ITEM 5010) TaxID=602072 RepID=A0A1R3RFQ3_ASPC5|nr:hypothetical protein ASPCADRAFT_7547 [Aspergillus carbonarius ITEM 5010]